MDTQKPTTDERITNLEEQTVILSEAIDNVYEALLKINKINTTLAKGILKLSEILDQSK